MPAYSAGSPCKSRDPSVKLGQCILIRVEVTLCPAPPRLGRAPAHGTHTPAPRQTPPELGSGQRELTPVLGAEEVKMQLFSLGVLQRGGVPRLLVGVGDGEGEGCSPAHPHPPPRGSPSPLPQITGGWESFLGKHRLLVLFLYSFPCIWMWPLLRAGYETVPRCDPAWLVSGMNQRRSIPASPCSRARVGYPLPPAGAARGTGCPAPSDQPLQHRQKRV